MNDKHQQNAESVENKRSQAYAELLSALKLDSGGKRERGRQQSPLQQVLSSLRIPVNLRNSFRYETSQVIGKLDQVELSDSFEETLYRVGVLYRRIQLEDQWWRKAAGPHLGSLDDGTTVALLPRFTNGYYYVEPNSGKRIHVNQKTASRISSQAICFYRSLPSKALRLKDMFSFLWNSISSGDLIWIFFATGGVTLLALLLPQIYQFIFDNTIPGRRTADILPLTALLLGLVLGSVCFTVSRNLIVNRMTDKLEISLRSAMQSRLLSLDVSFYKQFSTGDLLERSETLANLLTTIMNVGFTSGLSAVFSLTFLTQMAKFGPNLIAPGFFIVFLAAVLIAGTVVLQSVRVRKQMEQTTKLNGLVYAVFGGIQKIKLAGAESRIFLKWADQYAAAAKWKYNPPVFFKISSTLSTSVLFLGTIILYQLAAEHSVSQSDYIAFSVAYGAVSSALLSISGITAQLADIKGQLKLIQPILDAVPEITEVKRKVSHLNGAIDISNLSFRYEEDLPNVLDDFSLRISPGEYIAVVGKSGCGKSTLLRLLIGFEQAQAGAIYYDEMDLAALDLRSLRQRIGVCLQDGKLFSGDIFSNIVVTAPWSTMQEAWEAARLAGMEEDIENMPMGMLTHISEGSGDISGGQLQRILIARAIVSRPSILLFDEATSALDNIAQQIVSDHLTKLGCTRIVIAHRLSTVKDCDRIILMEDGRIKEEGCFEEMMEKKGAFYEFAKRQLG